MFTRNSHYGLVFALLSAATAVSAAPVAAAPPAESGANDGAAKTVPFKQAPTPQSGYEIKGRNAPILALDTTRERRSPILNRNMAAQGALYGDGEMEYIEGPSVSYQRSSNGPVFEAGALGGGMETAPFLAHVAMNWTF